MELLNDRVFFLCEWTKSSPLMTHHVRDLFSKPQEPNRKPPAAREDEPAGAGILEVEAG